MARPAKAITAPSDRGFLTPPSRLDEPFLHVLSSNAMATKTLLESTCALGRRTDEYAGVLESTCTMWATDTGQVPAVVRKQPFRWPTHAPVCGILAG